MKKWVVVAVLALFAGTATAQQELDLGSKEFKDGEAAYKKKDWDAAISNFEAAIGANDTLFASYYYLGWAYQSKKNFEKSAESFVKYLDKAPDNPDAADMVIAATRQGGLAYARGNQFEQAIPLLNKAADAKPNDAEVQFFLGMSHLKSGVAETAEGHFNKVNQLQPNLDLAWYYAGYIAYDRKDWSAAKERLSKYVELKPKGSFAGDAHSLLGLMAMTAGDKSSAKSHMTKCLELKPDSPQAAQAHYILGSLAAQSEQFELARSHFQAYLRLQPTGPQAVEVKKFLADMK